ncbi:PREDICTED: uncharacterized protein LOC104599783 [Nelumbo nucifera]|uniref:Uncharacterized protein LOC104599783 n=1 Tax=Nelumbo nucifera TaxID=4432 RepID=A0A1U8A1E1_NELNU|nr:PREDICTED: uncharacterized protein LOC104599783 [Nelumbo nucifera]XP_010260800.1 PREDICTED: uncharacterized protein LOC104599783 [Nelumbo nucifera]
MPQELPGFYYDPEKNRYFPIKGPIPGSSRYPSSSSTTISNSQIPSSKSNEAIEKLNTLKRKRIRIAKLLQVRELHGKVLNFNQLRCNFQQEYQMMQASHPVIWKYQSTDRIADSALEQLHVDIQTAQGQSETDVLLMGNMNGSLSLFEFGRVGQLFDYGVKCMPDCVWPLTMENQSDCSEAPGHLWRPTGALTLMPSCISCIKRSGKHYMDTADDNSVIQNALITTLGSETSGGSIFVLNLSEPLEFSPSIPVLRRRLFEVASLNCTIWTADCNSNGTEAIVGTSLGAALVNLETGVPSWVCRSKSDVFSQQFNQSGNVVVCGLRNGAIVTVDVRQRQEAFSARLPRHRVPYRANKGSEASSRNFKNATKQWFELKGNIHPSCTIFMPSSISSLVSLQSYDQYFLASSMDGSIYLYDHRLLKRGAIQSYEGHVNSHTRIQLGVDPSERLVLSGGEDGNLRIWSIKTGEMLFRNKISNLVPSTVCWTGSGAWLGSREGIVFMQR